LHILLAVSFVTVLTVAILSHLYVPKCGCILYVANTYQSVVNAEK